MSAMLRRSSPRINLRNQQSAIRLRCGLAAAAGDLMAGVR
jgi:hypothetical protein